MPRHDALTVGDFAQRATILAGHTDGMAALLGQTGVIEHEDAGLGGATAPLLAQPKKHSLVLPRTLIDELLQRLVVATDPGGQRLNRLALTLAQQALQILAAPVATFAPTQLRRELCHEALQLLPNHRHLFGCHHASAP